MPSLDVHTTKHDVNGAILEFLVLASWLVTNGKQINKAKNT